MSNLKTTTTVFPFLPTLTLIFITLKLIGYINWSWWWVLSPILIPLGIMIVDFFVVLIIQSFMNKNKK
jgi:hypothetical protein